MKNKIIWAVAIMVIIATASCKTKKADINQQLIGLWAGIDTIQITAIDTAGAINIETIAVPVVIEYFADTTMSGKVHYNDSTAANIQAVVLVGEPYISYSGVMDVNDKKHQLQGELFYQEDPESLTMEFIAKDPATGTEHKGNGVLTRQTAKK